MKKYVLTFLLFLAFACQYVSYGQNRRFSLDLHAGIPIPLVSISPALSTYGGAGIRYNLSKEFSVQGLLHVGTLAGKQKIGEGITKFDPNLVSSYASFSNNFIEYSGNIQLDLNRLFGLRNAMHRLNPYLVLGGGYIYSDVTANRPDGIQRKYKQGFYMAYGGLTFRYYLNPEIDLTFGGTLNVTETYFLDAIPVDRTYDKYILTEIGISYKIGAKSDKQHIEWNNVILPNRILLPNLEKMHGQPIDEAGQYIMFNKDSIEKIQAINKRLQQENTDQQKQIALIQSSIDDMQKQVDELKKSVEAQEKARAEQQAKASSPTPTPNATAPAQNYQPGAGAVIAGAVVASEAAAKNAEEPKKTTRRSNSHVSGPPPVEPKPNAEPGTQPTTNPTSQATTRPGTQTPQPTNKPVVPMGANRAKAQVNLNSTKDVVAPLSKYNVIVGSFSVPENAYKFRDKLRKEGYDAVVIRSETDPNILRVSILSSPKKMDAVNGMKESRTEIDPKAWIHIYNQK